MPDGAIELTDAQLAEVLRRRPDPERKLVDHAAARKRIDDVLVASRRTLHSPEERPATALAVRR